MYGVKIKERNTEPTFDTWHLFAVGFVKERELTGHWVKHLDKIWEKQDDFHFMIGQMTTTADALSSLNMRTTQEGYCGTLV